MRCCSKDDDDDVREARLRNQHQIAAASSSSDDEGSTTTVTETTERRRRTRDVGKRRGGSNDDDDARDRRGGSDFDDDDDLEAGGGFDDERDSYFEAGVGGRRSAWDRAVGQEEGGSGREDASPTHSTFGRDSERNRRMRKTARLVAERLGGIDSDEDDDEFEPGLGAPADIEQGFGFVSKDDVLKRKEEMERQKREEEQRRAEKARRKAEKKKAKRDEREKRARFTETDSETVSLLEGRENERRRKRSFFTRGSRAGNVMLAVVAASAVIATAVGVILYAPTSSPKTVEIRGTDDGVLTTADPSLHPLKATTDKILHHLKHFTKKSDDDAEEKEKADADADADADALETEKKKDDDSLEDVDDDEERDAKSEEESKKSHENEAMLGAKKAAAEPEIYATSSCAPVHRDSKHGIYNQFNSACYHKKDLIGCVEPTVGGCQKCYLADSAAASQKGSYAHCSHDVCKTYNVKGCLAEPQKVEEKAASHDVTLSKVKRKAVPKSASRVSRFESDADDEIESCLPNLEDAKRGVFQYSERSCRTLGHSDVDYSGCIAVGKSSCRMCVTRSALRTSTFSLCPKSVCHHHDLLFQQCAGEEDQVDDEDEDDELR
jgi:hypothetical protein